MSAPVSSRGALGWLGAALAGGLSAAAFAVALAHAETMLVFLAYLAAIPLFVVGLGAGAGSGVLASLIGTAGLSVVASPNLAMIYTLINALPVAILVALAMRYKQGADGKVYWYPEGWLLTFVTLYPCVMFLIAVGAASSHEGGLLALSQEAIRAAIGLIASELEPEVATKFTDVMTQMARIMPALVGCSWMFLMLISALVAQGTLRQQGWQLRSPFNFAELHIPQWLIAAVAVTGLMGFFASAPYDYIGTNLCIMLCVPFFFVGLAVVHAWAARRGRGRVALLIIFYILLSLLPWLAIAVALLGALDQGLNIRGRLAPPQPNNGT